MLSFKNMMQYLFCYITIYPSRTSQIHVCLMNVVPKEGKEEEWRRKRVEGVNKEVEEERSRRNGK